ncbi:hypothetical protein PFISCL1PPCAC_9910, partial [Pristionchus fissidentatus]
SIPAMVLSLTPTALQSQVSTLTLESGTAISYIAAAGANPRSETKAHYEYHEPTYHSRRRGSGYTMDDDSDDWEGVNAICQLIDTIMHVEREYDFFENKNVLELGFCTGLPSVLALAKGANEVAVHCQTKPSLEYFVRPTLHRAFPSLSANIKLSSGDLIDARVSNKFDIILAPELLNCPRDQYDEIHAILDRGLTDDGVCFISSRTSYLLNNSAGSLQDFLTLLAKHRKFVPLIRWTSRSSDLHPRQIIQITRNLNY